MLSFDVGQRGESTDGHQVAGFDDVWGQVSAADGVALATDDRLLDDVAEFAEVAGPAVAHQRVQGAVVHAADLAAGGDAEAFEEVPDEQWQILGSLAEGGISSGKTARR